MQFFRCFFDVATSDEAYDSLDNFSVAQVGPAHDMSDAPLPPGGLMLLSGLAAPARLRARRALSR